MNKRYDHSQTEEKIYQLWEKHDCFNPDSVNIKKSSQAGNNKNNKSISKNSKLRINNSQKRSFCIIMPPPNANDPLHIGHAMFVSLEDIMVRYHRMLGDDTVWIPGTDHAGIETQFVFEKKLKKQGKSRFNYDRETLYKKIWNYVQANSDVAVNQIKKLGASADWNRFKFTLDKDIVETVLETFFKLHKEKLIYRENRLVNYCTKCGTAFSNLEVKHVEQKSPLYYIKYGPLEIATTRPETKFADIALAVNPEDKRYQQYIGQKIEIDCVASQEEAKKSGQLLKLKVIADDFVDPEFGTGVVKITPFHDFNDFEFWQKHKEELPKPQATVDFEGRLTSLAGKYERLKTHIAREQMIKDLEEKGLLIKIDKNYQNNVGTCYRCGRAIEPLPLPQFYIKVKPLTEPVLEALDKKEVVVYGTGYDKILRHWLETLEDWNISRQIVWGIRMPVWYDVNKNPDIQVTFINEFGKKVSGKLGKLLNLPYKNNDKSSKLKILSTIKKGLQSLTAPMEASYAISKESPSEDYIQETDTFDTWFSSSQWPFVTLQNNKKDDFKRFYPTTVMETAYDILMFWVMRMLMMGIFATGEIPFKQVYLHGLIRDTKGAKMSKSKGNVVNPLEITEKYGADALRIALIIRSTAGLDKSISEQDFKAARNLTNKLWNAARFILLNREEKAKTTSKNKQFTEKLNQIIIEVSQQYQTLKIGLAADTLYNEFWHWYCDQCIEEAKQGLISQEKLIEGLIVFLKLFHPIIPFVTESIWQELRKDKLVEEDFLIIATWPEKI